MKERHSLSEILRKIEELPGDFWVRVLYTHPLHLTEEFIELLGTSRHLVPYLDVPLQHINSAVLKSMRRGMDGEKTKKLVYGIRKKFPKMTIRTTMLVGYPGETQEAFDQLYDFVKDFEFDRLGAFDFSPEPGTPAYEIKEGRVPRKVAVERRDKLLALQKEISLKRNKALVGSVIPVLVEEKADRRHWIGRSTGDAPEVDQSVCVDLPPKTTLEPGAFIDVKITRASEYDLGGVPVENSSTR